VDPWLLIGFLFIGTAPTTMSSNVVMTRQAHGNPALTVVQSIIGQFLCPFLTPILLQMYLSSGAWYSKVLGNEDDNYGEIYKRVFKQLGLSLFIPMAVGQVVRNVFPGPTKKVFVDWKMSKLPSFALLTVIWQTFDQAFRSDAFSSVKPSNIVFIVFISIALYFIWLGICFSTSVVWLPRKDTIACCYCEFRHVHRSEPHRAVEIADSGYRVSGVADWDWRSSHDCVQEVDQAVRGRGGHREGNDRGGSEEARRHTCGWGLK
jgi:sodium/bile acid cotransporter 7